MRRVLGDVVILLAFGVAFTVGVGTANALQTTPAAHQQGAMSAEDHLKILTAKLNLTEDQQIQLRPIMAEESKQMKAVQDDTSLSPTDMRAKIKSVHESFAGKIAAVLTPEQRDQWQEMRQQMMDKHKAADGQAPADHH